MTTCTAARPRRLLTAALTALTALGLNTALAQPAGAFDEPAPRIEQVPGQFALARDAIAGPDGAIWQVVSDFDDVGARRVQSLERVGVTGQLSRTEFADDVSYRPGGGATYTEVLTKPSWLSDGGAALVVRKSGSSLATDVKLLRFDARGKLLGSSSLPQSARRAISFAVANDGTVWWARNCLDALYRRDPSGEVTLTRLPKRGCGAEREDGSTAPAEENGTALTLAADGGVWLMSVCKPRLVRLAPDGSVRQWERFAARCRTPGDYDSYVVPPTVTADQTGGIAWSGYKSSGRIDTRGRIVQYDPSGAGGFFDLAGTAWTMRARIAANPTTVTPLRVPDGRQGQFVAPAWGGGAWIVGSRATYVFAGKESYTWYDDASVQLFATDGTARNWALPPMSGGPSENVWITAALTGADGALWVSYWDYGRHSKQLYRVTPPDLPAAAPTGATATAVTGRSGRAVTVQLRCDADPGRFCSGSVRLGGAARAARYVLGGQRRAGVRLTLGDRAAARLRRGWRVRTTALVVNTGATSTRTSLTVR